MHGDACSRRRGYFLDPDTADAEAEGESAEGFTLHVRLRRPLRERAAIVARAAAGRRATSRRQDEPPRKDDRTEAHDHS